MSYLLFMLIYRNKKGRLSFKVKLHTFSITYILPISKAFEKSKNLAK